MEITDDGTGLTAVCRPGVGFSSMRERAEELGGSCVIESLPAGGTRVSAQLPR
jgi:signal transduction histidine kinase